MARAVSKRDPIEFDDVMMALSKAKAAWWFLSAAEFEYIQFASTCAGPNAMPRTEDEAKDIKGWLTSWCLDNLHDALREADAAFRKSAATGELRDEAKR